MSISDSLLTLRGYGNYPGLSPVWRRTIASIQQEFQSASQSYPILRHVILQAYDQAGTIPASLECAMLEVGGFTAGEMWPGGDIVGELSNRESWILNDAPEIGYLYGPHAARNVFENLAAKAWLALPGTRDGKTQAYPQERLLDRWMTCVYRALKSHPGSYLEANEVLWVCWKTSEGENQESKFDSEKVIDGNRARMGYPQTNQLPGPIQRWKYSALAGDVFTASAVAIDVLLAHPDPEGPYLISHQEMDAFQSSPTFQNTNHLLGSIRLGEGRAFPIFLKWGKPVRGSTPSVCPNANPPSSEAGREALAKYLPKIVDLYRNQGLISKGETIHWVGRRTELETGCSCNFDNLSSKQSENSNKKLAPSRQKAYSQYLFATAEDASLSTDQQVYDWLYDRPDGEDLPDYPTWSKYLREARKHFSKQKHTSRRGREKGRSIVSPDEI